MAGMQDLLGRLTPYRRRPRPASATSYPIYMDGELARIEQATTVLSDAVKALASIVEAQSAPPP